MKIRLLLLLLMLSFICTCETPEVKENNADIIISFDDMVIFPDTPESTGNPATHTGTYELDIDNDEIIDVIFKVTSHLLGRESNRESIIETKNQYQIAYQDSYKYRYTENYEAPEGWFIKDSTSVQIPKLFTLSDTISNDVSFTEGPMHLAYYYSSTYMNYHSSVYINNWAGNGEGYIAITNKSDNIFCWIRLEVIEYAQIMLKSYKYTVGKNSLTIEE